MHPGKLGDKMDKLFIRNYFEIIKTRFAKEAADLAQSQVVFLVLPRQVSQPTQAVSESPSTTGRTSRF